MPRCATTRPIRRIGRRSRRSIARSLCYNADQPEIHELVAQMRAVLDDYSRSRPDRRDLSAVSNALPPITARTCAALSFRSTSRSFMRVGCVTDREPRSRNTKLRFRLAAGRTGFWAITTSRALRHGSASAQARVAAMLLLTLRGTPTMYYGDEIGLAAHRGSS